MSASENTVLSPRLAAVIAAVNSLAIAQAGAQNHYFVDDDAPVSGDGSSWGNAFRDLQDALDAVRNANLVWAEIRIAQGTYTPDRGTLDRTEAFALTSAVTLVGGYAGLGAPNPDQCDPARFVSVLSGDLRRNDTSNFGNRLDNSYHVVDVSHANGATRMDGLTIRGGHANGQPNVNDRGAGVVGLPPFSVTLNIARCIITDNFATRGAALDIDHGWVRIEDSLIAANRTEGHAPAGVAVFGSLTALRSRFVANINASGAFVGSAVDAGGTTEVFDCLFDANGAGGPAISTSGFVQIARSTLVNNSTADYYGAVRITHAGYAAVAGCIIRNTSPGGVEIVAEESDTLWVGASCIAGGEAAVRAVNTKVEWLTSNIDADPLFISPTGPDNNHETWHDNDYSLPLASPCIDRGTRANPLGSATDLFGNPRYIHGRGDCRLRADMGAIEFQGQSPPPAPVTVFVRADAPPGGDGSSWESALPNITDALATPGVREVRVAAGIYTPHITDRRASFEIECEVALLGGFSGNSEDPEERDPQFYQTVLSADLLANDDTSPQSRADNSFIVVRLYNADATIDGFIVQGADGPDPLNGGGGCAINIVSSTAVLSRCVIRDCILDGNLGSSGAVTASRSDLTIDDCLFTRNRRYAPDYASASALQFNEGDLVAYRTRFDDNSAECGNWGHGGAVVCHADIARFVNCSFTGNRVAAIRVAGGGSAVGGAAYLNARDILLVNCLFADNQCLSGETSGNAQCGAASISGERSAVIGCTFFRNVARAAEASAGALTIGWHEPLLADSTIYANQAISTVSPGGSGGVNLYASDTFTSNVVNSIIWRNQDASGHGLAAQLRATGGFLHAAYCCIEGWDGSIPGVHTFSADPLFRSPDDLRLATGSPCIDTGRADFLRPDEADLDQDGDTTEPTPLDAANRTRVVGAGLDIGAFETQLILCPADYNNDTVVNTADFFTFLADFFAGNPRADFNADTVINSQDVFDFLNAFMAGC